MIDALDISTKTTRIIMGMPITVCIEESSIREEVINEVFDYFAQVDERFSTYKEGSEISQINAGKLSKINYSKDMKEILNYAEDTKRITNGYFDILTSDKSLDPSGIVKGWAIDEASKLITAHNIYKFYIEAGGDIQVGSDQSYIVGVRNPKDISEILLSVKLQDKAIATSGNYLRGQHIYDPHNYRAKPKNITSLSIISDNIFEADRFATAAFAMGNPQGLVFIDLLPGFEVCLVDEDNQIFMTKGFSSYVQ